MVHQIKVIPWPDTIDYNKMAVEVPGTKRPGQTGHYRSALWPELITAENQPVHTLQDVWASGLSIDPNAPCLGRRPVVSTKPLTFASKYEWETYAEIDARRRALGATLYEWFSTGRLLKAEGGYECVGIWFPNRPEWQIIDLALQGYGMVSVSLYDTLGSEAVQYIINHASLSVIFTTPEKIPDLLRISKALPALRVIISIDELSAATKPVLQAWSHEKGIQIFEMKEWEAYGRAHPRDLVPVTSTTIASICYTSGTTGFPKGVLLSHGSLAVVVASNVHGATFPPKGKLFSYLPLAHIYERFAELVALALGGGIGYFTGDPLRLLEDAQVLRPNYFPSVPRVLNRVYASAATAMSAGGFRANLLKKAVDTKLAVLRETGQNKHPFWDRLIFRKIQAALGGNIDMITSGSAPIAREVIDFLKIAFACDVIEGDYGLTENCATSVRCLPYDAKAGGTVGPPQPCNEVKLVDVPAMGYTALDQPIPRGELCIRGANNFVGYYKDPANTSKTLDEEGWLHTGDVASLDGAGRIAIIDRIKNIMKLSQGEYVALEKVENTYSTVPGVASIFVYGDSLRDHLVGIVVPDPIALSDMGVRTGITKTKVDPLDVKGLDTITANPKVYAYFMDGMNTEAKKRGLKGFEQVKSIYITNEQFTPDNGTLTATLKIKRKEMTAKYKDELETLYSGSSAGSSASSSSSKSTKSSL